MKWGVVVFPGSNDDHAVRHVLKEVLGEEVRLLWHRHPDLQGSDCIVLPGGFSFGDYLRPGAMAKFSEIMPEVVRFAERGGIVLGICNGFQILCEAGLLPGTLIKNHSLRFVCQDIDLQVVTARSRFTAACYTGEILRIPIKHGEGCYFAAEEVLRELEAEGRIILRYACPSSPNGSLHDIAAILSSRGNVLGMMPHPEHASEGIPSSCDGLKIFQSILQSSTSGLG